jgi:hypothetical protein
VRGGWERERDDARARRLPSVEDLPRTGDGYDRAAVEAAFESFYRHAAEVDRTLEVLEAVAAFQREAGSLRADIRSLRAAAWGPVPTLRHAVATTAGARVDRGGAAYGAWPRVALYSAFIILVAVGAALADMSSGAIVLIVLAAWAIVGLAELAVSGVSGRAQPLPYGYPAWAVEPATEEEEAEAIAEVEEFEEHEEPEPVVEAAVEPEVEAVEPAAEVEPAERPAWRPWRRPEPEVAELEEPPSHVRVLPVEDEAAEERALEEPEPVVEAAAHEAVVEELVHDEPEPEVEALEEEAAEPEAEVEALPEEEPALEAVADEAEAEAEFEPEAEAEPEPEEPETEAELEPEPEAEAEPVAEAELAPEPYETPLPPERQPRLRFWRRRPQQPPALPEPEPSEPRHVRIVDIEPATAEEVEIPWEGEQPAAGAEEELDAWERAEVPPEPLFEPAAQPPVRASGPGEGVRGNREVPPTTNEALEPEAQAEPEPTATAEDEQTEEPGEHTERRPVFMRRGRR